MNLMKLLRLVALFAVGSTWLAVAAGLLGVGARPTPPEPYVSPRPSYHDAVASPRPADPGAERILLVDRSTGRIDPFPVPEDERWGLFSVSPWRDRQGHLEAVGRWVARTDDVESQAFCGLGLLRLPDATVTTRIPLDVLPTGRPCWVPGRPREFLFPAADGGLYRCRLAEEPPHKEENPFRLRAPEAGRAARPASVVWQCAPPGCGAPYLADPFWPSDSRLRRFVFVALGRQVARGKQRVYARSKLWWLLMSEQADAILASGSLTAPQADDSPVEDEIERLPNVAIDRSGKIRLVHLRRKPTARVWQLCAVTLEIDHLTGTPRQSGQNSSCHVMDDGLALAPLLVSVDGRNVYASTEDGRIIKYPIPSDRPTVTHRATKATAEARNRRG
jgi:hypothetical protein